MVLAAAGCTSAERNRLAVGSDTVTFTRDRDDVPFRSEEPLSFMAVHPILEVTLVAGVGMPVVAVSYPRPLPDAGGRDARMVLLFVGVEENPGSGDAGNLVRFLELDEARAGLGTVTPPEVDGLFLTHVLGSGLEDIARLVAERQIDVRQLGFSGVAPVVHDGAPSVGETAIVDFGNGDLRRTVAASSVLGSGRISAGRYAEHARSNNGLARLLAAVLAQGTPARLERLFAGKPNLASSLPEFGASQPVFSLLLPERDIWIHGDARHTDRANALAVDLRYGAFRLLLLGDLEREGQERLASFGASTTAWDATCIVMGTAPGLEIHRAWSEGIDLQAALGFGGGGDGRYPPAMLATRARPGTLFLTGAEMRPRHLRLRTDGEVFQIESISLEGGKPTILMPWRRCLPASELEGLRRSAAATATER